ncbi:MAG: sigma-54-dependent Fis family transcriptional regulator [Planctomycetes bacterium]|nr:sigma-54-dependent Fis family transcriptional regulator [Planctomycetota bacterium]
MTTQKLLSERLAHAQYSVTTVGTAGEALAAARKGDFDAILLDVMLPDSSGIDLLGKVKGEGIGASIVMMSGRGEAEIVVGAMRLGAMDYLVKPIEPDKMLATVGLAVRAGRLDRENRRLRKKLSDLTGGNVLVGMSPALRRLTGVLSRVAETDATVLIEGRPGSGKTLAAHLIQANCRRSAGPFVTVFGDAWVEESVEASLREAERGMLLIEDVDRMGAGAQARLVRYLKERRPGDGQAGPDVRVVATTSARLPEQVARGRFREDLYYRLNVFPVVIPSLQERREDIALLATHFLKQSAKANGLAEKGFSAAAMILLETHPWPGNVAQLQNAVFRAHAMAGGEAIDRMHLLGPSTGIVADLDEEVLPRRAEKDDQSVREEDVLSFEQEEKRILSRALRATKGNVRRAAQLLRIGRATLYRKIQVYKLRLN